MERDHEIEESQINTPECYRHPTCGGSREHFPPSRFTGFVFGEPAGDHPTDGGGEMDVWTCGGSEGEREREREQERERERERETITRNDVMMVTDRENESNGLAQGRSIACAGLTDPTETDRTAACCSQSILFVFIQRPQCAGAGVGVCVPSLPIDKPDPTAKANATPLTTNTMKLNTTCVCVCVCVCVSQ